MEVSEHRKIRRPKLRRKDVLHKQKQDTVLTERRSTRPENVDNEKLDAPTSNRENAKEEEV